jgi:hypothetical protein
VTLLIRNLSTCLSPSVIGLFDRPLARLAEVGRRRQLKTTAAMNEDFVLRLTERVQGVNHAVAYVGLTNSRSAVQCVRRWRLRVSTGWLFTRS